MSLDRPHRKQIRHYHQPGDFHELTFSCYRREPLLTDDDWRQRLSRCIERACNESAIYLVGFVFMPEHVHLLVYPWMSQPDIARFLARIKQPFSKQIKDILVTTNNPMLQRLTVRERPGKHCFRYRQEGPGYDRNIYTPAAVDNSLGYIHNNPVERKLCDSATDWKWSSARYYLLDPPRQQFAELPHVDGMPPGTFDEEHMS